MSDNITNFLAAGIEINGTIRFSNDMQIDGKIEGEITSEHGSVTIGESAEIKGNITAGNICIYGSVEGEIKAQKCQLKHQSRLKGDIKTKTLSMEEGAQLSGRTEIG